jgi:uncharacterized protein (DUF4415 family)
MAKIKLNPMDYPDTTIDDPDNPELTDADFAKARPFSEVFPEQHKSLVRQGGRPRVASPKVHIGFRLSQDVIDGIRATGEGYNARVEAVLRDALKRGRLTRKAG